MNDLRLGLRQALLNPGWKLKQLLLLAAASLIVLLRPVEAAETSTLVDVGGRKIQMAVQGNGSPTIVIESGMGEPPLQSGSWNKILGELARSNRVVLYNRAGLGQSDPATKLPRTCTDVAEDLNALLTRAAVLPYLLVGHSYGGLHVRMFASRFPGKVAGMVLVDASHPDQDQRWLVSFGPAKADDPASLQRIRNFLSSRTTPSSNPEQIDPKAVAAEIRMAGDLGDKPLVILTHSAGFKIDSSLPEANLKQIEEVWTAIQNDYRRLSTRSVLFQSRHGGHNLPGEDPELVVFGIRQALSQIPSASQPGR